jgi:AcrR family transcriptional regulator
MDLIGHALSVSARRGCPERVRPEARTVPRVTGARNAAARSARGRRADYAALTRQAIIDTARMLFAAKGFFATTVEDMG